MTRKGTPTHLFKGKQLTVREIAARTGLTVPGVRVRLKQGIPLDAPFRRASTYLFEGKQLTVREIAARTGLNISTTKYRLEKGISLSRLSRHNLIHSFKGKQLTVREIAARTGLSPALIRQRLKKGISLSRPSRRVSFLIHGMFLTAKEVAYLVGDIGAQAVHARAARGDPLLVPRGTLRKRRKSR